MLFLKTYYIYLYIEYYICTVIYACPLLEAIENPWKPHILQQEVAQKLHSGCISLGDLPDTVLE